MDEDNNPIIKNTGDINIDTTTYFQQETQNITQNGDYIYEQNENGAWHLELKPQDSTEPTDVNININTNSKINFKGVSLSSSTSSPVLLRKFDKTNSQGESVTMPGRTSMIYIENLTNYDYFSVQFIHNSATSSKSKNLNSNVYYRIFGDYNRIYLYDENNEVFCDLYDVNNTDSNDTKINLYKNKFNLILN